MANEGAKEICSIQKNDAAAKIVHYKHEKDEENEEWDNNWDPMAEDYASPKNTLALDPEKDPLSTITGQVRPISSKLGNVTICDRFAKYGECADGEYCDKKHVNPNMRDKIWTLQNTFESNKNRIIMTYNYLSPIELQPDPEALLLATVTNSISPENFFILLPYETMNFSHCTLEDLESFKERVQRSSSAKTKLQKCHEQLAAIFDHPYRVDNVNDDIYPSQIVACKLQDGRFRRAVIVGPTPDMEYYYKLFLLDVGIEVELPRELIYDIKAHCLSEPPMAVPCRLNIMPSNGERKWSQEALNYFISRTRTKGIYLYCAILDYVEIDRIFIVDLLNTKSRQSLTDLMVSRGFAERRELLVLPPSTI